MNQNLPDVFNNYNVNILFTVAALPARVTLAVPFMNPTTLHITKGVISTQNSSITPTNKTNTKTVQPISSGK